MGFICMTMKNHFHIKGEVFNLVLIQRPGGTKKWPIFMKGSFGNKVQDKKQGRKIKPLADPGEGPGGPGPPLFFDQNGDQALPLFFPGSGAPPPPPYLEVWIRH